MEFFEIFSTTTSKEPNSSFKEVSNKNRQFEYDILDHYINDGFKVQEFIGPSPDSYPLHDGLRCFFLSHETQSLYLCLTNPKIRGGTFSIENLNYLHAFLDYLETENDRTPFLFILSSAGVRLTQKRVMFNSIWSVLPRLFLLKKQRPYFTLAHNICLGAAALFFGQGHFRIASTSETLINLTGPGVINTFFGEEKNFSRYASASHQFERHLLVQEYSANIDVALKRISQLLRVRYHKNFVDHSSQLSKSTVNSDCLSALFNSKSRMEDFFKKASEAYAEILPNYSGSGKSFLVRLNSVNYALLINPLDHPSNVLTVNTVEKYIESIKIFKALQLPLVVITDTPGGDPRQHHSDSNIIMKSLDLIESLCDYPFKKVGIIAGRCYGGSGLFALPIVHGSEGLFAIKNSRMGAISDEFIEKLALANPSHYAQWKESQASHKSDLSDMLKSGNLSGIIEWEDIGLFLKDFLNNSLKELKK
ncbi:MAG: hypothetical protein KDD45_01225 [Bdellovibrionales bacterium]|nr:hypothetical protein [Bdellovibrionales bacterium]